MNIIPQISQIRELKELQVYAQAQYNTILQLTKQKKKLEDEIKHLQELLSKTVPIIKNTDEKMIQQGTDQELICKMELQKLREASTTRELLYEEAKRVQIYTQVLNSIPKTSKEERMVEELKTEELLKLVKNDESGKQQ